MFYVCSRAGIKFRRLVVCFGLFFSVSARFFFYVEILQDSTKDSTKVESEAEENLEAET